MPIDTSFQAQYFFRISELYNEKLCLQPKRIKEKVIFAHHRKLLVKLILNAHDHIKSEIYHLPRDETISSLKNILANNWHEFKLTPCGYTTQPESDVTLLLCDIAHTLGQITGQKPIHILMPGVSTESIVDGVPSLDEMDLETVLRTHIVSDSGNYLYPIAALGSLACESDLDSQKIPNPCYDYNQVTESGETEGYIPAAALERMLNHSSDTQALLDAKARYKRLIKPTNLLGQLQLLIKTLRMNSVSGIGEEEQAGSRAYAGIISFNDYYQTLNNEQKNLIPADLKNEIEFLLALSGSKEQNDEGTANLQTCINIRQDSLASLTKQYESILINIGVDEQTQSELIKSARELFVLSQKQIQAQCDSRAYHGMDKLPLSKKLIDTLHVQVELKSEADLQDFLSLTAIDIKSLLENNEALQSQLVDKLKETDDLILFTTQTPIEQMKMVLQLIANKLPNPNGSELSVWLEMLDLKRFEIVLAAFKSFVIGNSVNFAETLGHLSDDKRDIIYSHFENVLPNLMQKAEDINYIFKFLNDAQRAKMFEMLKNKFSGIIQNAKDYSIILELLSPEQQSAVYQETKDHIPDIIKKAEDLALVLSFASESLCKEMLDMLKLKIPKLILNEDDIRNACRGLDVEQSRIVLKLLPAKWTKSVNEICIVLKALNDTQRNIFLEMIKEKLPSLIQSAKNVREVCEHLNEQQSAQVLGGIIHKIPSLIQTVDDYISITDIGSKVDFDLIEKGREKIDAKLASVIHTREDFGKLVAITFPFDGLFELVKDKLPTLLTSLLDVAEVIKLVDINRRVELLLAIINRLPNIFHAVDDEAVFHILSFLNVGQSPKVITTILPSLIQSADSFSHIFISLNIEQRKALLDVMKDNIPNLIKNAIDASNIFSSLDDEQFSIVFDVVKEKLPNIIHSAKDLFMLRFFKNQHLDKMFELIKHKFPSLIHQAVDIGIVLRFLSIEQCDVVLDGIKAKLPSLIKNKNDVYDALYYFNINSFKVLLEAIKDQLPKIFKTAEDVNNKLWNVDNEKRALIIEALEKAQANEHVVNPTFLPHKRMIEGNEPAKRQKRVGHREMDFLSHNAPLEQPRERKRQENEAKRQRMSPS